MERSLVALCPCIGYDEEAVYSSLKLGIDRLGGLGRFVSAREHILLKPNMLRNAPPERAITTHPAVFGALCRLLREQGYGDVVYGDSPGPAVDVEKAAKESGLAEQAQRYGIPLGDFSSAVSAENPRGKRAKRFMLANEATKADAIISICKMKTHALENITGAVKNQYGCIYGTNKAAGHAKYPNSRLFADMLAELNMFLPMRLYIMDGIIAMEGNGPASGTPKAMHLMLISDDPVALDSVFAHIIYLDPHHVPTCVSGAAVGLGKMESSQIAVLTPQGEITVEEVQRKYGDETFDVKRDKIVFWQFRKLLPGIRRYTDKPVADQAKCIGCGICQRACPVQGKAVHAGEGKKAVYDYRKCIRCYCCQEMCPEGAIQRIK